MIRLREVLAILAFAFGFAGAFACARADEPHTNPPVGIYVSLGKLPELLEIELKTNGLYSVLATGYGTNSQTGVWKWNATNREFSLTPNTNAGPFRYQLRVLRMDPQQPEVLQWIPAGHLRQVSGALDYIRFKRKGQQ